MPVPLVIQSALLCLAWMIATRFARSGIREHFGQVFIYGCAAVSILIAVLCGWDRPSALFLQAMLVLGPYTTTLVLQRGIQKAVNSGDLDRAVSLSKIRLNLFPFEMYRRQLRLFEGLAEVRDRAQEEGRTPAEVLGEVILRPGLEPLQDYALIAELSQRAAQRDWPGIVEMFEGGTHLPGGVYDASARILLVRAYCELGDLEPAIKGLHQLEQHPGWRLIRSQLHVAWLAVLATGGRREAVDELLQHQLSTMPLPVALGWRARAAWAAGSPGEAKALLTPLLALELPEPVKESLEERMEQLSGTPPSKNTAIERALDRLEQLMRTDRLLFQSVQRSVSSRPATTAILTVMLAVFTATWILADWPASRAMLAVSGLMLEAEPWRLAIALFMNEGWLPLLVHGLVLIALGNVIEGIYRPGWTVTLFLLSGVAGTIAGALVTPQEWLLGTSSALLGWYGAILAVSTRSKSIIPEPWRASLRQKGALILGLVVLVGLVSGHFHPLAWVTGMATGLVLGMMLPLRGLDELRRTHRHSRPEPRRRTARGPAHVS